MEVISRPAPAVVRRDGTIRGGHLLEARVRPTLEMALVELPTRLKRKTDEETGLSLLKLGKG